jgi:hypothetical protein
MADDELRLIAMFEDRASAGLKQMIEKMRSAAKGGQQATDDGAKTTIKHDEAYRKLWRSMKATADITRTDFLPGLEKIASLSFEAGAGLGALTGAIGVATAAAKSFGDASLRLGREGMLTGLTDDEVSRWERLAPRIGTTGEAVDSALEHFNMLSEKMKNAEPAFRMLFASGEGVEFRPLRDAMLALKNLPREQQLEGLIHFMDSLSVRDRRRAYDFLGFPKEFATQSESQIREYFARINATTSRFTDEQRKAAGDAALAWMDLSDALDDFKNHMGAAWAPGVTAILKGTLEAFEATGKAAKFTIDTMTEGLKAMEGAKKQGDAGAFVGGILGGAAKGPAPAPIAPAEPSPLKRLEPEPAAPSAAPPKAAIPKPWDLMPDLNVAPGQAPGIVLPPVVAPAPAPVIPGLSPEDLTSRPGLIHKSAFFPGGEDEGKGPGAGSNASTQIQIIGQGTRIGVYAGMIDFWQYMRSQKNGDGGGGSGGVSKASFEAGGGPGGAPGGSAGAGLGGSGGGGGGSGGGSSGGGGSGGESAPGGAPGASSGGFMDALANIESGNRNIFSGVDKDVAGPGTRSQGYFQINTPTWREFAAKAGVDLAQYPDAMHSPRDVQAKVASTIPLARFGPRTRRMIEQQFGFGEDQKRRTIGDLTTQFSPPPGQGAPPAPGTAVPAAGKGWNASIGGIPAELVDSVKKANPNLTKDQCVKLIQGMTNVGNVHDWRRGESEINVPENSALATFGQHGDSDRYAYGGSGTPGIGRDHGLFMTKKYADGSFDAISQDAGHPPHLIHMPNTGKGGEGDASSYFGLKNQLGEAIGQAAKGAVAAGQAPPPPKSAEPPPAVAAPGYDAIRKRLEETGGTGQQASNILDHAGKAGVIQTPGSSKVTGEASLSIKLAGGLAPDGGVKTSGSLFKEIQMDRGAVPYATNA